MSQQQSPELQESATDGGGLSRRQALLAGGGLLLDGLFGGLFDTESDSGSGLGILDSWGVAEDGDLKAAEPEIVNFRGAPVGVTETAEGVDVSITQASANGLWKEGTDGVIRPADGQPVAISDLRQQLANRGLHYVGLYSGDTLDQKIKSILSSDEYENRTGSRIIVHPPDPDSPAATTEPGGTDSKWKWESKVQLGADQLTFDFGWANTTATATIESFFEVGANEKRENITFNGGFFYTNGNVTTGMSSPFLFRGVGHLDINRGYVQGAQRDDYGSAYRFHNDHGISGVEIHGCETTGGTYGVRTSNGNMDGGGADETLFDGRIIGCRMGGGTSCMRLVDVDNVLVDDIQAGGAAVQSVSRALVEMRDVNHGNRRVTVRHAHESNNDRSYSDVVLVRNDNGNQHTAIYIDDLEYVNATEAFTVENTNPLNFGDVDTTDGTTTNTTTNDY